MLPRWLIETVLVGTGGFVGSALRYGMSGAVHRAFPFLSFPVGTLTVNVIGCLLIGWLGGLVEVRQLLSPAVRLFFMLGLLGGFTTYSTFGFETVSLVREGNYLMAVANTLLHVGLGLTAVWAGFGLAKAW